LAGIGQAGDFVLRLDGKEGQADLRAGMLVNAAGPYLGEVSAMLGDTLPVSTVFQQKIAFPDVVGAISRQVPFAIDLDGQSLDWSEEERALLGEDPAAAHLAAPMPGGIHCRPDGGDEGQWIKLGWAFNRTPSPVLRDPPTDPHFPEIVLRAASRLHPAL